MLVTVSVAVCAAPEMETDDGMLQVGLELPEGETAQERFTVPVKLLAGVTEMVEVLPVVAPAAIEMLPLFEMVNVGAVVRVVLTTDVCVMLPLVAVTVTA